MCNEVKSDRFETMAHIKCEICEKNHIIQLLAISISMKVRIGFTTIHIRLYIRFASLYRYFANRERKPQNSFQYLRIWTYTNYVLCIVHTLKNQISIAANIHIFGTHSMKRSLNSMYLHYIIQRGQYSQCHKFQIEINWFDWTYYSNSFVAHRLRLVHSFIA